MPSLGFVCLLADAAIICGKSAAMSNSHTNKVIASLWRGHSRWCPRPQEYAALLAVRVVAWDLAATDCVDLQGDNSIEPTTANYTFKHVLENQHDVYEIDLCPSQLKAVRLYSACFIGAEDLKSAC